MSEEEFTLFQKLIYKEMGIHMSPEKRPLLTARLQSRLTKNGYTSFREYFQKELKTPIKGALNDLVERVTTNHTYFWRENAHFEFMLKTVLPEIEQRCQARGTQALRTWCAAASTGQEPWTLAILLKKHFGSRYNAWDSGLLATDLSQDVLETASNGIYTEEEVSPMPADLRNPYFKKSPGGKMVVSPELKKEILFRRFNLMTNPYPFKKPFDIIFCRNVMIYFDDETKRGVIERMARVTYPGGYLFVGKSESVGHLTDDFVYVNPGSYRRVG